MTVVVRKTTLEPVWTDNTGKFEPLYYWIDPDLSAVSDFPYKYWQEVGGVFSLVNQAARDTIDAAEVIALDKASKDARKRDFAKDEILAAFVRILIGEINLLRAEHGLAPRTAAQLKAAIATEIDAA